MGGLLVAGRWVSGEGGLGMGMGGIRSGGLWRGGGGTGSVRVGGVRCWWVGDVQEGGRWMGLRWGCVGFEDVGVGMVGRTGCGGLHWFHLLGSMGSGFRLGLWVSCSRLC